MCEFNTLYRRSLIALTIWAVQGGGEALGASGPDLSIRVLQGMESYGVAPDPVTAEPTAAYAVATTVCNLGDSPAVWEAGSTQHPIVVQNMYRLAFGLFEQVGMSWASHEFFAVQQSACGDCTSPFPPNENDGDLLGVGCSTPTSAALHGAQNNMGPRSQVNAYTGEFAYPFYGQGVTPSDILSRRLMVRIADIDPPGPGLTYYVETLIISPDDAQAGNGGNNVSFREAHGTSPRPDLNICPNLTPQDPDAGCFVTTGPSRYGVPAIRAWRASDLTVAEVEVAIPEAPAPAPPARVILAARKYHWLNPFDGWTYYFAVQNINSDRSIRSFQVPLAPGSNIFLGVHSFHDVFYHSGEGVVDNYSGDDWPVTINADSIVWETDTYAQEPLANALRWGTLYNFSFHTSIPLDEVTVTLGLFKPVAGLPDSIDVTISLPGDDCIDGIECTNDSFDILSGTCQHNPVDARCGDTIGCNGVESCDAQLGCLPGVPLECDDGAFCNGVETCEECPDIGECCFQTGVCLQDYPREDCLRIGGTPDCIEPLCVSGPSPCDDGVACTVDTCDEDNDLCMNSPDDSLCDDGLFCSGIETCDPANGCQAGVPVDCEDSVSCTTDSCSEPTDACLHVPVDAACNDADSCTVDSCVLNGCNYVTICGACCTRGGGCLDGLTAEGCELSGGPGAVFRGEGSACGDDLDGNGIIDTCEGLVAIPVVSEWGLIVLALGLMALGKVYFRRHVDTAR